MCVVQSSQLILKRPQDTNQIGNLDCFTAPIPLRQESRGRGLGLPGKCGFNKELWKTSALLRIKGMHLRRNILGPGTHSHTDTILSGPMWWVP